MFDYHNIHVVYTKEAETADAYIEKLTHKNGEKQTQLLHEKTDVTFYPISDHDLKEYIATGDPLDCNIIWSVIFLVDRIFITINFNTVGTPYFGCVASVEIFF
mgnify:CR=1 FL=1